MVERTKYAIPNILVGLFFYIIPTIFSVLLIAIFIANAYPINYMALLLITLLAFLFYNIKFGVLQSVLAKESVAANTILTTKITDYLMASETIQSFAVEDEVMKSLWRELRRNEDICCKVRRKQAIIRIGQVVVLGIGMLSLSLSIIMSVINHQTSPGSFVLFTGYLVQFISPVNAIGYVLKDLKKAFIEVGESCDFIRTHLINTKDSCSFPHYNVAPTPTLIVKNLTYRHRGENNAVFQNINFMVPKVQTVRKGHLSSKPMIILHYWVDRHKRRDLSLISDQACYLLSRLIF